MKKLWVCIGIIAFSFIWPIIAFSTEITLINTNKVNNIEVTYQICRHTEQVPTKIDFCNNNTVTLKDSSAPAQERYFKITPPDNMDSIYILYAIEKNSNGDIIAKANFPQNTSYDLCRWDFEDVTHTYHNPSNHVFALNDLGGSSVIGCFDSNY